MGTGGLVDGGVGGSASSGAATARELAPSQRERGLDGLRGLAVIAVLLFHQGFGWARGGYLGVSLFFTLSGFLIARLLLTEVEGTGRIRLGAFWQRRLRRLAVAALAALALVCAYGAWFATESQKLALRGDVWASLAQVANWRFVGSASYADLFQDPSPVQHFWSLAIEEQFYLVFPLLLAGVVFVTSKLRQPRWSARRVLAGVALLLMAGSLAAQLLAPSADRIYYGTDTRAFELLAGVLLACWWRPHGVGSSNRVGRVVGLGGAALLALVVYWWSTAGFGASWLFHGGFALVAVVSAIVIASATVPGPVRALGSLRPLVAIGLISYGVYLYHWPVYLALDPARTGLDGWELFALRGGVTIAFAAVSYHFLEMPIRRGVIHTPKVAGLAWASGLLVVVMMAALVIPNADRERVITSKTFDDARALVASRHARSSEAAAAVAVEPLRVYVVGDSTGVMFAAGLALYASETGMLDVRSGALEACPLGTVDALKWYIPQGLVSLPVHPECARLFDRIAADLSNWAPQLVLVVAGPSNTAAFHPAGAPGDTWLLPTDPAGRAVIAAGARRMNEELGRLAPSVPQLWFTAPYILRPDSSGGFKDPRGPQVPAFTDVYNSVVGDLAEARPLVATVPWADVFNSVPVALDPRSQIDGVHAVPSTLLGILRTWFAGVLVARDEVIAGVAEDLSVDPSAPF